MKKISIILLAALLAAIPAADLMAQASKAIALTLKVTGDVQIRKSGAKDLAPLKFGTPLDDGDYIRTGDDGRTTLIFADDKSQIKLNPRTEVTISGRRDNQSNITKRISMEVGELFAKVEKQRGSLEIATPTSVASVKGTEFWVLVFEDGTTQIITLEGLIELMNRISGNSVNVGSGNTGSSDPEGNVGSNPTQSGDVPNGGEEEGAPPKTIRIELRGPEDKSKTIIMQYIEE